MQLASAWVGDFDGSAVSQLLELPDTIEPMALITVGYPAELPELTPRLPLTDVVDFL